MKARFWLPAIHQPDVFAAHDVAEELRDHARAAFLRGMDRIQAGADPVERAEQREVQAFHAVAPDHAIHQLLGAGIDPARLVDRAADQFGMFRIEFLVMAHAVDFGRGGEHQVLAVLAAERTIGRLASKSSSNTRSGSLT